MSLALPLSQLWLLLFPRNLEHSTILYEDHKQLPLMRLSWNKQDPNYLATFAMEATEVRVLGML